MITELIDFFSVMLGKKELLPSSSTHQSCPEPRRWRWSALEATVGSDLGETVLRHGDEARQTNLLPHKGDKTSAYRFPVIQGILTYHKHNSAEP